ncbi:MAG: hypothetical protein WD648_13460 [Planctomycetaceae bacterium]
MSRWEIISRTGSLIVVSAYLVFAILDAGVEGLQMGAALLIPLAMIWFPEQLGSATGFIGHGRVNVETPPFLISFMGWLILFGLPVIVGILSR